MLEANARGISHGRSIPARRSSAPAKPVWSSLGRIVGPTGGAAAMAMYWKEITLHWNCKAKNAVTGADVSEGRATRVYARINEDGTLSSQPIPADMVQVLRELGDLKHLGANSGRPKLPAER